MVAPFVLVFYILSYFFIAIDYRLPFWAQFVVLALIEMPAALLALYELGARPYMDAEAYRDWWRWKHVDSVLDRFREYMETKSPREQLWIEFKIFIVVVPLVLVAFGFFLLHLVRWLFPHVQSASSITDYVVVVALFSAAGVAGMIMAYRDARKNLPTTPPHVSPAPTTPPFSDELKENVWHDIAEHNLPVPTTQAMDIILNVGNELYASARYDIEIADAQLAKGEQAVDMSPTDTRVRTAIRTLLVRFIKRLPRESAPFQVPVSDVAAMPSLIFDLVQPLRDLAPTGILQTVVKRYNTNVGLITQEVQDAGKLKKMERVDPQDYSGDFRRYLDGTPQRRLLDVLVPYQPFTENDRCAHHWCVGRNQQGKSTYLRHLIWDDLQRAARGECSVVVIDSKSMINHMRELKLFGPGQPLDGNLILIDSDYRFPLNPFYIGAEAETKAERDAGKLVAKSLISYMLGNLDPAPGQERALPFFIDATLHSRDKNLHQLLKYVQMDPEVAPSEIKSFPSNVQDWFRTTRKGLYSSTKDGLDQRLASFLDKQKHTPFFKNLNASRWGNTEGKFDLFDELHHGGKVLLVDTDLEKNGDEGTNLMGRLFVAMLWEVVQRRTKLENKKPIYVYMDEAADYLTHDKSFGRILTRSGEARLGFTVAYQFKGQEGVDPSMEKALNNASIHSECIAVGNVEVTINQLRKITLPVQRFEFKEQDKMERDDYIKMRQYLAFQYPYKDAPAQRDTDDEPLTEQNS